MFYELCVLLIFPFALIFAGISDAISFTISNKISIALFLGFIVLAPFSGLSIADIGLHVMTGFFMLMIGFVLFARGYIGGGDAKIIAATSLWLGPTLVFPFLFMATVYGGLLALLCLYLYNTPLPAFLSGQRWLLNFQTGTAAVPYGVAIGVSGLSVYPQSIWLGLF